MKLEYKVKEQTLQPIPTTSIPRVGSKKYLDLEFHFGDDWKKYKTKTVFISANGFDRPVILTQMRGNVGNVEVEEYFTNLRSFQIHLHGAVGGSEDESIRTNALTIALEPSGDAFTTLPPTTEIPAYMQMLDLVERAESIAEEIAESYEKKIDIIPYSVFSDLRSELMSSGGFNYRAQSIAYDENNGRWFLVGGDIVKGTSAIVKVSGKLSDWSNAYTIEFEGHHANDCVYNPRTNKLVVVSGFAGDDNPEANDVIAEIDVDTMQVHYIDKASAGLSDFSEFHSIAYADGYYYIYDRNLGDGPKLIKIKDDFSGGYTVVSEFRKSNVINACGVPNELLSCQSGFIIGDVYYQVYTKMVYTDRDAKTGSAFDGAVVAAISLKTGELLGTSQFDWTHQQEVEAAVFADGKLYWVVDSHYVEILESQPSSGVLTKPQSLPIPAYADIGKYFSVGVYTCNNADKAATLLNCPISDTGFTLEVIKQGSQQITQIFHPNAIESGYFLTRTHSYLAGWGRLNRYDAAALDELKNTSSDHEQRIADLEQSGGGSATGSVSVFTQFAGDPEPENAKRGDVKLVVDYEDDGEDDGDGSEDDDWLVTHSEMEEYVEKTVPEWARKDNKPIYSANEISCNAEINGEQKTNVADALNALVDAIGALGIAEEVAY